MEPEIADTKVTARFTTRDPSLHIRDQDRKLLISTSKLTEDLAQPAHDAHMYLQMSSVLDYPPLSTIFSSAKMTAYHSIS
jgi:hypothetical protein